MKKFLLFAAAVVLATGCVDNDYDLENEDFEDFEIGNSDTEFRLPLATITVKGDAIGGTYDSLENIFNEADTWTPSEYKELSLTKLANKDQAYLDKIITDLLADVKTDAAKRRDVIDRIVASSSYANAINSSMPKNPQTGEPLYSIEDYIDNHFDEFEEDSRDVLYEIVDKHLESLTTCISSITQELKGFNIDEGVINALANNSESLKIYGTVKSALPIDCIGNFSLATRGEEGRELFGTPLNMNYGKITDIDVNISGDGLRGLVEDMDLTVSFAPTTYYPRNTLPGDDDNAVEMELKIYKKGGLNFN